MRAGRTKVFLATALVIVATLSLVLGPTSGAIARRSYRADLSIGYGQKSDEFQGNLDTAGVCEKGRLITVYQVRPGSDRSVGKEKTDGHGDYAVANPAGLTGRFYARTRVSLRGDGDHLCRGDKTEPINVTEP